MHAATMQRFLRTAGLGRARKYENREEATQAQPISFPGMDLSSSSRSPESGKVIRDSINTAGSAQMQVSSIFHY